MNDHIIFNTEPPECVAEPIDQCPEGMWRSKAPNKNFNIDPGLSFECGKYLKRYINVPTQT